MGFSPSPKSSPGGARSSPSPTGQRTLTPQRKHRKMLKDGTSEVWPESVEKIFVDGLRQYWESPWATYSRGRSRWRNQFLVDYLKEAGIERSKKQVASHIQVLRNMWKGEKEYQLVAGGEELFQENGLLHKSDPSHVLPPSDVRIKEEYKDVQSPFAPRTPSDSSDFQSENESAGVDALHAFETPDERTPGGFFASVPLAHNPQQQPRSAVKDEGYDLHLPFPGTIPPISSLITASITPPHIVRNSITAVSLSAAGMQPLLVEMDRYAPPSPTVANFAPPRVSIHIKLSLSSLHDVSSPPALHGFSGTVTLAAPWTNVAQCVTRVFAGGVCESVEYAYFEPAASLSPLSMAPVTVPLPESELSRCRWGNIGVETRIDQLITVDHEELAWIAYDLTWTASGPPTAEVLNVQRDSHQEQEEHQEHHQEQQQQQQHHLVAASAPPLPEEPASFLSVNSWNSETSYAQYASYVPRSQEPPIAYSPYSSLGGSSNGDQHYTHYSSVLFS